MARTLPKQNAVIETTAAQIAVHWREEEYYYPSAKFVGQANLTDPNINERFSEKNFPECFREYADMLSWDKYWDTTLDTSDPPFWKWFVGGKINASYNCVDRHLAKYKNKAAIIFVPEPEGEATISVTYRELYVRVNEFAALLRDFCGLKSRRSRHHSYADGPRVADYHAGMRPPGRDSLGCVWRLQRRGLRHARRRFRQPGPDHDGWLLSQRQAARPQSRRRYSAEHSQAGRPGRGKGPGLEASPRPECVRFTVCGRARFLR